MSHDDAYANVEELRAQHEFLLQQLGQAKKPENRLHILESLQGVVERLKALGVEHRASIRASARRLSQPQPVR